MGMIAPEQGGTLLSEVKALPLSEGLVRGTDASGPLFSRGAEDTH